MPKDGPLSGKEMKHASTYHTPILVDEILDLLRAKEGGIFVDGTLGGGGHSEAFLNINSENIVFGIDRDKDAIAFAKQRLEKYANKFSALNGNYEDILDLVQGVDSVTGILVDAGVSSYQLDTSERGFSFRKPGPLDMRMGEDAQSLEAFLAETDLKALTRVLKIGEVDRAYYTARAILDAFNENKIKLTTDLAEVILSVNRRPKKIHPATLVFQALRIEINDELGGLRRFVERAPNLLSVGGRIAVMTFHSLEDRIVKRCFSKLSKDQTPKGIPLRADELHIWGKRMTRKPIMANAQEVELNPRSRSAKLRVLERISEETCTTYFAE